MTSTHQSVRFLAASTVAAGVFAGISPVACNAQWRAYDHRSTVLGDQFSGAAEYREAVGRAAYLESLAAQLQEETRYTRQLRIEAVRSQRIFRDRENSDRREAGLRNRQLREIEKLEQRRMSALTLLRTAGAGEFEWPSALLEPPVREATSEVERILAGSHASAGTPVIGDRSRLVLATAVLRDSIRFNRIGRTHLERVQANRVVLLLEHLASLSMREGEQLAAQ